MWTTNGLFAVMLGGVVVSNENLSEWQLDDGLTDSEPMEKFKSQKYSCHLYIFIYIIYINS